MNLKSIRWSKSGSFQRIILVVLGLLGIESLAVFPDWVVGPLRAQNIYTGVPFNSIGNSYFEKVGINWSVGIPGRSGGGTRIMGLSPTGQLTPNLNFSFNGGNVIPPFGGYQPGVGGRLDLSGRNFRLGLSMAKGSTTMLSSQAPSMVVQNGFGGTLFSGQMSPFVSGYIPVVGGQTIAYPDNAVTRAINSGLLDSTPSVKNQRSSERPNPADSRPLKSAATQGDKSVSAIKQERAQRLEMRRFQVEELIAEAEEFLQQDERLKGRRKYLEAIRYSDDPSQRQHLRSLADSLKPTRK